MTAFYCLPRSERDGLGRQQYSLTWWGFHPDPSQDWSVRSQIFFGVIEEARVDTEHAGGSFLEVASLEDAIRLAEHDGARVPAAQTGLFA